MIYDIENAEYLWREWILSLDEKLRFILGIIIFSDRVWFLEKVGRMYK